MMQISPQISGVSVVALGDFNPLIFRPDWLQSKEIIVESDLNINVVHADIVEFSLPWGEFHVDRERASISSLQEPLIGVHDFFIKCFQYLPETPIRAVGINRDIHFDAGSSYALDRIGDALAPKEIWGDFVRHGDKKVGGLRSLTMEQATSVDGRRVRIDGMGDGYT
jgi:hypothetical protein